MKTFIAIAVFAALTFGFLGACSHVSQIAMPLGIE
jgi:hypothetical protein